MRMRGVVMSCVVALGLILAPHVARAGIIALSGSVAEGPPAGGPTAFVSLFDTRNLMIDWDLPQAFPFTGAPTRFTPAGTPVFEYLVDFSPVDSLGRAVGSVTFDRPILGIFPQQIGGQLEETDVPGFPNTADIVTISADSRTISFDLNVNGSYDVFTFLVAQSIPEPSSGAVVLTALMVLGALRLRRAI